MRTIYLTLFSALLFLGCGVSETTEEEKTPSIVIEDDDSNDDTPSVVEEKTYFDKETQLEWQDAPENNDEALNWSSAIDYCATLQYTNEIDWRLPSLTELSTLDRDQFTYIEYAYYWSSSENKEKSNDAWLYSFSSNLSFGTTKSSEVRFRCVRGEKLIEQIEIAEEDNTTQTENNTTVVVDKTVYFEETQLEWQDARENATLSLTWQEAIDYCDKIGRASCRERV